MRTEAAEVERREVQVHVPLDASYPSYVEPLLDEFAGRLDGESEFCDDQEEEWDEVSFYLYGPDQDRLVALAREVFGRYPLPGGVYAVKTSPGREDTGEGERVAFD
ncbi:hypothetical protein ACQPYH_28710 [Kribbella sp. CA-245084]|uniref:hypothetical protein n=1 Tax=Kribbella sp. CA-245084 TaxID=3239940 RepID=UPI003D8DA035